MSRGRFSPRVVTGIIAGLFFATSLCLRIIPPYHQVFSSGWIKFTGVDAYYHMRLVDNLLHHFPLRISFDPYTFFPHGEVVPWPSFFDWLIGGVAWLAGFGSPTARIVDIVGVYSSPILAALTIIPVYFIGKELFHRWAGVIAAGLIAVLPGEFLGRSVLGFTDHHAAEVLFTSITMLLLILAIKTGRQRQLDFNHLKQRDRAVIARPLIYSLLGGLCLGVYLLTWVGGLLFVFIIFAYLIIQFVIDHLRGESTDYLSIIFTPFLLITTLVTLPLIPHAWFSTLYYASLPIALLTPLVLSGVSRLMASKKIRRAYYPLALAGVGIAGLVILYAINPSLPESMFSSFGFLAPGGATSATIAEMHPLLSSGGGFSVLVAWGNFTTGFFLALISLGVLIYFMTRKASADKALFIVWSLIILAATLGQRRFAYYFAVNVALLTGYLSWLVIEFAGSRQVVPKAVDIPRHAKIKHKRKKHQKAGFKLARGPVTMAVGAIVIFFLSFFPNIVIAINIAGQARFAPDNAWYEALSWLKDNSPEPFTTPEFYYELYEPPPEGMAYDYPESAYGIAAWWDYGHWITRIAHRIPNQNPFQSGVNQTAPLFIAQDEASANKIIEGLGSKYIIIDYALVTEKFYAIPTWVGGSKEEYQDVYYQPKDNKLVPVVFFLPAYYRSLAVRLYNFNGGQVTPQSSTVVSYRESVSREGKTYKEITSLQTFPTYERAEAYAKQQTGNYKIVSNDRFTSPIPLEALKHYKLVYSSETSRMQQNVGRISLVKIFEYVK